MEDETIKLFGNGEQLRDFVFIEDVVEAFLLAGCKDAAIGQVFNIGHGRSTPLLDCVTAVIDVVGRGTYQTVPWPDDYAMIETGDCEVDISKASKTLNWSPCTELCAGIQKTADYYTQYRSEYW
jgi:nucleoside-diphosphate-sugar epimerase